MTRQIIDLNDLQGKTIAKAVEVDAGRLGLIFADGSFFYLKVAERLDRGISLHWKEPPLDIDHKVKMGLMSGEECDRIKTERHAVADAQLERWERHEFERLKQRFEPPAAEDPTPVPCSNATHGS